MHLQLIMFFLYFDFFVLFFFRFLSLFDVKLSSAVPDLLAL